MATLKGVYQRFVTSISRIWKREESSEESEDGITETATSAAEYFDALESVPDGGQFVNNNEKEASHSAPDLLEATRTDSKKSSTKVRTSKKARLSILKTSQNNSTPNLPNLNLKAEDNPSPTTRKSSKTFFRPISIAIDRPFRTKSPFDKQPSTSREHSPLTPTLQVHPPSPDISRESSPVLSRRSPNHFLQDYPPVVLRRQIPISRRKPATFQLRRENSSDDILGGASVNQKKRKPRPKSVSDIVYQDYSQPPKLKKAPSFLKLSPSVFRRTPSPKPIEEETRKQPDIRNRTYTLASRISKFASKTIDGTLRKRTKSDPRTKKIVVMKKIEMTTDKTMAIEPFNARLRDYNTYYEGRHAYQFKWKQDKDGNPLVDGMLNVYWGLKKAIRLQMQDSGVKIRPQSDLAAAQVEAVRKFEERTTGMPVGEESVDIMMKNDKLTGTLLRRRISDALLNREDSSDSAINVENGILGDTRQRTYESRRMALKLKHDGEKVHINTEDEDGLMRQKSVILRKRRLNRSARNKRYSINGHAYNYRTSVFTPAYASVTNVRVTSKSSCDEVIKHLLNKFRIENSYEEFSLYLVKETGERRELSRNEFPLVTRVLSGPNEQVCKVFVMDRNMHEDISSDVAQYFKLDMNILEMFVKKFTEEEEREATKLKRRYQMYRKMLEERIQETSAS